MTNGSANGFRVLVNTGVYTNGQNSGNYHTQKGSSDFVYVCEGKTWKQEDSNAPDMNNDGMLKYLRNAYYQIQHDINISSSIYMGIGGYVTSGDEANAFSGVIVGKNNGTEEAPKYPTVYISSTIPSAANFGGLVRYSQGSVIKNLTVSYAGGKITENGQEKTVDSANITMNNTAVPSSSNNPFFGGVVGYCMGGDTIIDNVSVNYGENSVTLSSENDQKPRLIAAGGYVGLVGGAKDSNGYEKTGGGVVFRNMDEKTNPFAGSMATNSGKDSTYFYCNPYVGRVLDGYACYDNPSGTAGQFTLNNTDKNYTIPDLVTDASGLAVETNTENSVTTYNVTVSSAQGLWLLSAIVNSGAGAMSSNNKYNHQYFGSEGATGDVDAYNLGKPRTASYDKIGELGGDISDEKFWGGVENQAKDRVSYLVQKYTTPDDNGNYPAAKIAGGNPLPEIILAFREGTIDMSTYGNGFRGIGSSFAKGLKTWGTTSNMQGRFLRVKNINPAVEGQTRTNTTINLGIDRHDYCNNYYENAWFAQGAGLFIGFAFTNGCTVDYLTLTGNSKLTLYSGDDGSQVDFVKGNHQNNGEVPVGGFAGRTANSSGELKFNHFRLENLSVYGGHHVAGAIGLVERTGGKKNITFKKWYVGRDSNGIGVSVSKKTDNDGSSAGLLGWCYGENAKITLEGFGLSSQEWNVNGINVNTDTKSNSSATAAGLIGACDGYSVTISDVRAKDITVTGKNMRECGGLADGGTVKVENCWIEDIHVTARDASGQVGGILGKASNYTTVTNCHLVGTQEKPIQIKGNIYASGLIGVCNGTTTISGCTLTYVDVLSTGNDAGGLIGQMNGNMKASNVSFSNVKVVTKNNNNRSGLLTGYTNGKQVDGYNILADSCTVGYNTSATMDTLSSIELKNDNGKAGLWFGQSNGNSTLVAVAASGNVQPKQDVGTNSGTTKITYADYPVNQKVDQKNQSASASPWLDVNPAVSVPVKVNGTTTPISLTGNAIGTGVAATILDDVKTKGTGSVYWNLTDGDEKTFSNFLLDSKDIYLTTYRAEEKDTTDVPESYDFPVLVVNNTATGINTKLLDYIAAMTNVTSGTDAKNQITKIVPKTYKWIKAENAFVEQDSSSLNVGTDKKTINVKNGAYDNQKSQITLLDVQYADPTSSDDTKVFHLYIPVLVKKVLETLMSVKFLAGTNYYASAYYGTKYATAGFNEPVTAYIEYKYKIDDWQDALDNGENLLGYYDKILDLAKGKTGDSLLPSGTRLTLVDRQTYQYYTYEFNAGDKVHHFNLSSMTDASGNSFKPVSICDLLYLKADLDNENGKFKKLENSKGASVKVDGEYYRKLEENENSDDKYSITVGGKLSDEEKLGNYLSEGYYLTLQIPSASQGINNNLSIHASDLVLKSNLEAPPAKIVNPEQRSYVIYDGVQQNFSANTVRIHNGDEQNEDNMQNGDSISVTMTSTLSLTNQGTIYFKSNAPEQLYHQFNITMKKYQNGSNSDAVLGAESATYTYTIKKSGEEQAIYTKTDTVEGLAGKDALSIFYGGSNMVENLKTGALIVTATVTFHYPVVADYFPERATEGSGNDGIWVSADSRVANVDTQLPITLHKNTATDKRRYYTENASNASLNYHTVNGGADNDITQQLGINPSDEVNNSNNVIYTQADYDYSGVDSVKLASATQIQYTMELFRKGIDGKYDGDALSVTSYLKDVNISNQSDTSSLLVWSDKFLQNDSLVWSDKFSSNDSHRFVDIHFTPLTGTDFETAGFTYANYKVKLTAVLLDSNNDPIQGTEASDYIIYTNARIYQKMISSSAETESNGSTG